MIQRGWWLAWSVASIAWLVGPASAEPVTETRDYGIRVDGKPAGEYHTTVRKDNGTVTVTSQAEVRVRVLLINYSYSFRGSEVWKDGRLQRLESTTNDDGKRFAVTAWVDGKELRVKSNGQERATRPDVWTTTYWRPPEARYRNQGVPLLDVDTGRDIRATLQFVGVNSINAAGQMLNCSHYRVLGGVQVDLWYDPQDRLVRQESIEDGHRTLIELTRVGR